MDVQLQWSLTILKHEDRNGDDPRLQFAFLTTHHGTPVVVGQATDLLFSSTGLAAFRGRISEPGGGDGGPLVLTGMQSLPLPPTAEDPYLGYAVRAVEEDNSKSSDRNGDFGRFVQAVEAAAADAPGGTPNGDALWQAANRPNIRNRAFRDDDDKIGVSVRVYPDYGLRAARASAGLAAGDLIDEVTELTRLVFREDGAHWELNVVMRAFA